MQRVIGHERWRDSSNSQPNIRLTKTIRPKNNNFDRSYTVKEKHAKMVNIIEKRLSGITQS